MSFFGRRSYRLRGYGSEWMIVRRSDLAAGERTLDAAVAVPMVMQAGGRSPDPELCRTFESVLGWSGSRDAAVRLERALRSRELVVVEAVRRQFGPLTPGGAPAAGGGSAGSAPPPKGAPGSSTTAASGAPTPEKTWFRCQLLDEDGKPMPNEKYKMTDSNGATREGTLDADGWVYIPPTLAPGACSISFPEIRLNPSRKKEKKK